MIIRFETELAFCQLLEWLIKVNKQAEEAERKKKDCITIVGDKKGINAEVRMYKYRGEIM
jgi:hypothetical protein